MAIAVVIVCAVPSVAGAQVQVVNTTEDHAPDGCDDRAAGDCTLRERVAEAVDGDVINLEAGTYELYWGEPLLLDENLSIVGRGARATTIDANGTSRVGTVTDADVEISGVTVTQGDANSGHNQAPGRGGAFYVGPTGELSLAQTRLMSNRASATGGAVSNEGTFSFANSLAMGNTVGGNNPALGGAFWSVGETTVFNSTISGNAAEPGEGAATRGGGVYLIGASFVEHATITGNSAEEGAGLYDASGESGIFGTIIAGNDGPECGHASIATVDEHHNLSDDTTCLFEGEGDHQGVDPLLAPLANNGGPTDTHALNADSPAIDGQAAPFCPPIDQRIFARPLDPCDIGAFESGAAAAGVLTVSTAVVNDDGGTGEPDSFLVHVRAGDSDVPGSPQNGDPEGTEYVLAAGDYDVSGDPVTGYTVAVGGDCEPDGSVALAEAGEAACTVTYDDVAPSARLTVVADVENDEGGQWLAEDFTVRVEMGQGNVDGSPQAGSETGTVYRLHPGTYSVAFDAGRGYVGALSDGCAGDGTVTLAEGEAKTCTITLSDGPLDAGVVIDGYGPWRTDSDWGIAERFLSTTRGNLRNPANFGPHGTVARTLQVAPGIRVASPRVLAGVDVFFTGWVPTDSYTVKEKLALRDFVVGGGTLIATTDDTGHTMVDVFGVEQGDGDGDPTVNTITDPGHLIANGPFGAVSSFNQYAATGHYPSLGPDAHAIGGHEAGPALAVIERGRLGPGSGAVILVADVDVFTNLASPGATVNETLIKNLFAFATGTSAPPGPPSGGNQQPGNQQPPSPPPPPDGDEQQLPPPVAGKNVNAEPAGGTVKVKVKGSRRFVALEEGQQIPVGSEIDTRKGRVTLEAAGGSKATFYDGLFRFDQGKGAKPLTTLTLIEKLSCPRGGKANAAAKRKKKRRLWGDGSGKFRTDGEFSSATVRGTKWLTEDRCDSTLTDVRKGRVAVRDFVKRRTVIVPAGENYVAKRKK